jgi:hypothetical protein
VRVARADDDLEVGDTGIECALGAAQVGHQRGVTHVVVAGDPLPHLVGVRHLRDRLGVHEADRFDPSYAGLRQRVDEFDLRVGGHRRLVLQAVARPHLAQAD